MTDFRIQPGQASAGVRNLPASETAASPVQGPGSFGAILGTVQANMAQPRAVQTAQAAQLAQLLALDAHSESDLEMALSLARLLDAQLSPFALKGGLASGPMGAAFGAVEAGSGAAAAASADAQQRFQALKPLFQQAEQETGVPWQIQAAQWALESGWGSATPKDLQSGQESYNLFGIKGTGPAGSVQAATTEYEQGRPVQQVAQFRAYHSYAESILEHARLLTTAHYAPARAAGADLQGWADQLGPQHLGYATDPQYSAKLLAIIHGNDWA